MSYLSRNAISNATRWIWEYVYFYFVNFLEPIMRAWMLVVYVLVNWSKWWFIQEGYQFYGFFFDLWMWCASQVGKETGMRINKPYQEIRNYMRNLNRGRRNEKRTKMKEVQVKKTVFCQGVISAGGKAFQYKLKTTYKSFFSIILCRIWCEAEDETII
jgi:hypothetical protein